TFRGEGPYLDGRRPSSVTFLGDIDGDLARRDFTVNAMAWDPIGGVLRDPFSGAADLRRRRLRAVGNALARFQEDGLRPLRALRLHAAARHRARHAARHRAGARYIFESRPGAGARRADQAAPARRPAQSRAAALAADGAARADHPRADRVGALRPEPLPPLGC